MKNPFKNPHTSIVIQGESKKKVVMESTAYMKTLMEKSFILFVYLYMHIFLLTKLFFSSNRKEVTTMFEHVKCVVCWKELEVWL